VPSRKAKKGEDGTGSHGQRTNGESPRQCPLRINLVLSRPSLSCFVVAPPDGLHCSRLCRERDRFRADLGKPASGGFTRSLRPIANLPGQGWRPAPQRRTRALDRERLGNTLASLSAVFGGAPPVTALRLPPVPNDRRDGTWL